MIKSHLLYIICKPNNYYWLQLVADTLFSFIYHGGIDQ